MKNELTLSEAAELLEKTSRQVRRYIKSGKLPARGGGHGVPYRISKSALAEFQASTTLRNTSATSGLITTERLARIAAGFRAKHQDTGSKLFPWWESTMLFKWAEYGSHKAANIKQSKLWKRQLDSAFQRCFPPVEDVPSATVEWAQDCASKLTPAQLDFIAALFVVVAYPWSSYSSYEHRAISNFHTSLSEWPISDDIYFTDTLDSGDIEAILGLLKKIVKHWPAKLTPAQVDLLEALHVNDKFLRDAIESGDIEEAIGSRKIKIKPSIRSAGKKMHQDRKRIASGRPSIGAACKLLGIHRYAGTRLWAGIVKTLGADDVLALFQKMGIEESHEVRRSLRNGFNRMSAQSKHCLKINDEVRQEIASRLGISLQEVPANESGLKDLLKSRILKAQRDKQKSTASYLHDIKAQSKASLNPSS